MSLTKRQISAIRDLHKKEGRKSTGLFIVEGERSVAELLRSSVKVRALYGVSAFDWNAGVDFMKISQNELERISALENPNNVLAVAEIPNFQLSKNAKRLIAACNIQDPGNAGTIIRTAHWFGYEGVILFGYSVDAFSPKVVQSSMGSVFNIPVLNEVHYNELEMLKTNGFRLYAADMKGENSQHMNFADKSVLILGSEAHGIPQEVKDLNPTFITISKHLSTADSLNVSVACGILAYEMNGKQAGGDKNE